MSELVEKAIVQWSVTRREIVGRTIASSDGWFATTKECRPERRPSQALSSLIWECAVVRDTAPDSRRRGSVIVRPIRPLSFSWVDTGEPVLGVCYRVFRCDQYPSVVIRMGDDDWAVADRRENAAYEAASAKLRSFQSQPPQQLLAEFGQPTSVSFTARDAVLVYPCGTRTIPAWQLYVAGWDVVHTGGLRYVAETGDVEAEFRFVAHPTGTIWYGVASHGRGVPFVWSGLDKLDDAAAGAVREMIRTHVPPAEVVASRQWENHRDFHRLDKVYQELARLHMEPARVETRSAKRQESVAESDDGYRPAFVRTESVTYVYLSVAGSEFGITTEHAADPSAYDAETVRREMIAARLTLIAQAAEPHHIPVVTDPDLVGMDPAVWRDRFRAAWRRCFDDYRREQAAIAVQIVQGVE